MSPDLRARFSKLPPFVTRGFEDDPDALTLRRLGGLTNTSYAVGAGAQTFVVRIAGEGTATYIDRRHELANHTIAYELGLAPQIEYCDVDDGLLVTRFAEGAKPLSADDLAEPCVLEAVTDVLSRLHSSDRVFRGRRDLFATLDGYIAIAEDKTSLDTGTLHELRVFARERASEHGLDARRARACHIDPAPSNFLRLPGDDVRLLLIDWEYASMCDPAWDLADLSLEARFEPWQDDAMLARHARSTSIQTGPEHLQIYKALLTLLAAAWAGARLAGATDAGLIERLSERFSAALDDARSRLGA